MSDHRDRTVVLKSLDPPASKALQAAAALSLIGAHAAITAPSPFLDVQLRHDPRAAGRRSSLTEARREQRQIRNAAQRQARKTTRQKARGTR